MKKATILMALVLLLSVCGAGVLAADVYEPHDQVVLTERVIYGDRSEANGLTLKIDSHYRNRLSWNTTLDFGDTVEVKTEYLFSAKQRRETYPEEYEGININNSVLDSLDMQIEKRAPEGISVAFEELYHETEPSQDGRKEIRLKDFISHYPIGFDLDFPNTRIRSSRIDEELRDGGEAAPGSRDVYIVQKIREYFRIPVLEDEYLEIHISKRTDGTLGSWGGGTSQYGDWYNMWGYSVLSDEACYFTFNTLTGKGKNIDISELPDGYGIFRLPYHMEYDKQRGRDISIIDVDDLEMVYPLAPGIEVAYLSLSAEQDCLYLHTVENEIYTITVIDLSTMETKQKLDVICFDGDPSWGISDQDDFMVIDFYHTKELAVISKAENGELTLEYICPVQVEGAKDFYSFYSYHTAMDFDGERLVLAQLLDIEFSNEPDYRNRTSCGIQVSVYEKDGMAFFGEYTSSLDTGEDWTDHAFYVQGDYYEPVIATWTG